MTGIERLLQEPLAHAIGWALLHFVWQGALVGALAAAALAALRRNDADVRYTVAAIALAVMGTLPIVTAVQTYDAAVAAQTAETIASPVVAHSSLPVAIEAAGRPALDDPTIISTPPWTLSSALGALRNVEPWIPVLVASWFAGVAILTLRLLTGWIWVQRMKTHGVAAAGQLQASVARLSKRLHIYRPVRLLVSSRVDVPTVIGWLRPVILLPVSALAGLSPLQVDAILAHELAHIRRHDYLVNLLQALLETLLFYHPAVWWLSRRIRAERENCCDDLAVSLCGDPVAYARALADLEGLRGTPSLVMAATAGHLLTRVRRLLLAAPASHDGRGPVWVAGATALVLVFTVGVAIVSNAPRRDTEAVVMTGIEAPLAPLTKTPPTIDEKTLKELERTLEKIQRSVREGKTFDEIRVRLQEAEKSFADKRNEQEFRVEIEDLARAVERLTQFAEVLTSPPQPPVSAEPTRPSESSPAAPSAPSAPSAPTASQSIRRSDNHMSWSHNGEKFEVRWTGEFELADDDSDIKGMTPGSELRMSDGGWFRGRTVEFKADGSGQITKKYWVGSTERPFEPEGKEWLARMLPRFVRESALGAKGRVARIYRTKGAPGVLAEITAINSSWAKRVYYTELLALDIPADARRQAIDQAGRDITSDYELASLLISQAGKLPGDAAVRKAYFDAARSIESDYELRRVLGTGVNGTALDNALLASVLDTSRSIDSDYELSSLLLQVVKQQSFDGARAPFFAALDTVSSSYERGRVLQALAERTDLSSDSLSAMLAAGGGVTSDYEAAQFLLKFATRPIEGPVRAPFFRAVDGIQSSYERGRVLKAVAAQPTMSSETMLAFLQSVKGMSGSYEASQVLQALAARHPITGTARDAYIDATEKLGDYEQGRALSALVKSDRARK